MIKVGLRNLKRILVSDLFWLAATVPVLFCIYLQNINILYTPPILADELAYIGIAAFFAGFDWSSTVSLLGYFSYGYPLLITPLFHLFSHDPVLMYRSFAVLNCALLSASVVFPYLIGRKLFPDINTKTLILLSFILFLFPSYYWYVNTAMAEVLLYCLFWLMLWMVCNLNENSTKRFMLCMGILTAYIHSVHQRTIGIVISIAILVLFMFIIKKISIKQLLFFALGFIPIFSMQFYLKPYLIDNLWLSSGTSSLNNMEAIMPNVIHMFSFEGIKDLIKSFSGKAFYVGTSSLLFGFLGVAFCLTGSAKYVKEVITKKSSFLSGFSDKTAAEIFLVLAALSSVMITAVFALNPNRLDVLIFGRYSDFFIGPLILYGLCTLSLRTKKIPYGVSISVVTISIALTIVTWSYMAGMMHKFVAWGFQHLGMAYFDVTPDGMLKAGAISVFAFCYLCFIIIFIKNNNVRIIAPALILCVFFALNIRHDALVPNSQRHWQPYTVLTDAIREIDEEDIPVYYQLSDGHFFGFVQFHLPHISVRMVSSLSEIHELEYLVIAPASSFVDDGEHYIITSYGEKILMLSSRES